MKKFTLILILTITSSYGVLPIKENFEKGCDKVIKKEHYKICYDYGMKGALRSLCTIYGSRVNLINIKKRPTFHIEKEIPFEYRTTPRDYKRSSQRRSRDHVVFYDRGHLVEDAAFDYDKNVLYSLYSMANIIPQTHRANAGCWADAESKAREMAVRYKSVDVLNVIYYPNTPKRMGKSRLAIPDRFSKYVLKGGLVLKRYDCIN
ncbi:MAG: DNA/RNA non-specific endonuclease, partial [Sulfurovum sp.]|nr:DNA/RNA non-specific endonuclease [Sulfurovum sp.]